MALDLLSTSAGLCHHSQMRPNERIQVNESLMIFMWSLLLRASIRVFDRDEYKAFIRPRVALFFKVFECKIFFFEVF